MTGEQTVSLWELADLATPWCLHVVATLRIANYIDAGIDQVDLLAQKASCDAYALGRVMTHLVTKGVFEEPAPGRYALNAAARGLLDPMLQLSLDLDGFGGRMAHAWGTMLEYVRTGESAYAQVFGRPFFEDLAAHPQISAAFDTLIGPAGHGLPDPEFAVSGGWEAVRTVMDVGGGTGAMLAGVLQLHPHLRGILVDQPATVERSAEVFAAAGVSERLVVAGQSFFDPLPAGADLVLLRGILNDWPDPEALAILKRCAEAARPAGRVVVFKSVAKDGTPRPLVIEMLLLGGKWRSLSEFRPLAAQAGLEVGAVGQQPSGILFVECTLIE